MDMKCSPWQAVVKALLVPDVERINEVLWASVRRYVTLFDVRSKLG